MESSILSIIASVNSEVLSLKESLNPHAKIIKFGTINAVFGEFENKELMELAEERAINVSIQAIRELHKIDMENLKKYKEMIKWENY